MAEQVLPDIRLHQHAEGMAPVADDILQPRPQKIGRNHHGDHGKEGLIAVFRDQFVHTEPGNKGEGQVDQRDHQRTGHVCQEKPHMGAEIAEEDTQQAVVMKVTLGHMSPPAVR